MKSLESPPSHLLGSKCLNCSNICQHTWFYTLLFFATDKISWKRTKNLTLTYFWIWKATTICIPKFVFVKIQEPGHTFNKFPHITIDRITDSKQGHAPANTLQLQEVTSPFTDMAYLFGHNFWNVVRSVISPSLLFCSYNIRFEFIQHSTCWRN